MSCVWRNSMKKNNAAGPLARCFQPSSTSTRCPQAPRRDTIAENFQLIPPLEPGRRPLPSLLFTRLLVGRSVSLIGDTSFPLHAPSNRHTSLIPGTPTPTPCTFRRTRSPSNRSALHPCPPAHRRPLSPRRGRHPRGTVNLCRPPPSERACCAIRGRWRPRWRG